MKPEELKNLLYELAVEDFDPEGVITDHPCILAINLIDSLINNASNRLCPRCQDELDACCCDD